MKHGLRTTEFWFGFLLCCGIYVLVYLGKYPAYGEPGYEGIGWMMAIWGAYTGYRGVLKKNGHGNGESK